MRYVLWQGAVGPNVDNKIWRLSGRNGSASPGATPWIGTLLPFTARSANGSFVRQQSPGG